jgi:hypothetical protein
MNASYSNNRTSLFDPERRIREQQFLPLPQPQVDLEQPTVGIHNEGERNDTRQFSRIEFRLDNQSYLQQYPLAAPGIHLGEVRGAPLCFALGRKCNFAASGLAYGFRIGDPHQHRGNSGRSSAPSISITITSRRHCEFEHRNRSPGLNRIGPSRS